MVSVQIEHLKYGQTISRSSSYESTTFLAQKESPSYSWNMLQVFGREPHYPTKGDVRLYLYSYFLYLYPFWPIGSLSSVRKRPTLLQENVAHGFYILIPVIPNPSSLVSTRVICIRAVTGSKSDNRVRWVALLFVVRNKTDPWFRPISTCSVKSLFVAVLLQRWARNQRFPRITWQWCGAVHSVGDERVQRPGLLGE